MVLSYVSLISFGPITVLVGRMSLNSSQHETEYRDHWLFFLSAGGQLEYPSAMVVGRGLAPLMRWVIFFFFWIAFTTK